MKNNHFWVDVRVGCIAVRDDRLELGEDNCLSHDAKSVVWFKDGVWDEKNLKWYLPLELEIEAEKVCKNFNDNERHDGK